MSRRAALVALLALAAGACLGPGRALQPRYFTPAPPTSERPAVSSAGEVGPELRLRAVRSAAHLRDRIVWRRSDVEYGFYEQRRWTQVPAEFLEARLARELFEVRGLRRGGGAVPTLSVELRAFDEVLGSPRSAAISAAVQLVGPRRSSLLERSYRVEEPTGDDDPIALARAMGRALDRLVETIADDVLAVLPDSR